MENIVNSAEEMKQFAAKLALTAKQGDVYLLKGDLGAGKTTFAQGFINGVQVTPEPVTSPTFNLIQTYNSKKFPIWHCDLYRLKNENEVINLGLEDAFGRAVMLIEWPDMAKDTLPGNAVTIKIEKLEGDKRKITIS